MTLYGKITKIKVVHSNDETFSKKVKYTSIVKNYTSIVKN
jgi:hypothetical protein